MGLSPAGRGASPRLWLQERSLGSPASKEICQHRSPDTGADFPVMFGDDSAVTQLCFFAVVKKSYSKQNSQAPDETYLRREFSHQSIDWCFAERHVLKPRTQVIPASVLLKSRRKRDSLALHILRG